MPEKPVQCPEMEKVMRGTYQVNIEKNIGIQNTYKATRYSSRIYIPPIITRRSPSTSDVNQSVVRYPSLLAPNEVEF